VCAALAGPAPARVRWTAPCIAGKARPSCHFWKAKIAYRRGGRPIAGVSDGDTIQAKLLGSRSAPKAVRFIGINAMELSRYSNYPGRRRGACHALEATRLVEHYIQRAHEVVRLGAQHASSRTGHRLYRSVAVRSRGRWLDLGRIALERGLALWLPHPREYAHNAEYHRLAEEAAAAGRGLYDPDYCGAGPSADAALRMWVNWDADGNDAADLNGEWIEVRNAGGSDVPLGGWWFRDSYLRFGPGRVPGFRFPPGTVVRAGGSLRLYVGCGRSAEGRLYWCQDGTVFENAGYDGRGIGDGGYLFDPQGDLRLSSIYPCVFRCADPLQGRVTLSVRPRAPEYLELQNVGAAPADLAGHLLKLSLTAKPNLFTHSYPFTSGPTLAPGETLRLWVQGSPQDDDRLTRHWGLGGYVFPDGSGRVTLRSFTDVVAACDAWGSLSC
jgi:endonuclease YncB( thermonuclease family)